MQVSFAQSGESFYFFYVRVSTKIEKSKVKFIGVPLLGKKWEYRRSILCNRVVLVKQETASCQKNISGGLEVSRGGLEHLLWGME